MTSHMTLSSASAPRLMGGIVHYLGSPLLVRAAVEIFKILLLSLYLHYLTFRFLLQKQNHFA